MRAPLHTLRVLLVAVALAGSPAGCAEGAPPVAPTAARADNDPGDLLLTAPGTPIALRRSVVADEYFWLRTKVLEGDPPPLFGEAFSAMHELRSDLAADPTAYEDLEVPLGQVSHASELVDLYAQLPEKKDVGGRMVSFRADAVRLARAMSAAEGPFKRGPYREHAGAIEVAAKDLGEHLVAREGAILQAIQADMGFADGVRPLVITLVNDAPFPGIFAADARGRNMASFVRVRGLEGSVLVETVLQESLHALDEMTVREPTALNALRAALAKRGVDDSDTNAEMAITTVTSAEAASLVRRFVDPGHRALGEKGFYTLYPPAPAIVAAWSRHVDAGEALELTADAIARAVTSSDL
ncbi:MAG: hypothetical protein JWP97_1028 [Labilithrix sp.]|nr:hypothetical protein [Labilithrix sp.]